MSTKIKLNNGKFLAMAALALSLILIFQGGVSGQEASTATYEIVFESTWSPQTHPFVGFPSNEHYSPLIGATHNDAMVFWEVGGFATDGIELMAETGGTSDLRDEVDDAINNGMADQIVSGTGMSSSPSSISIDSITVSSDFPNLTLVSMIAPSPDWFIGVGSLSLQDDDDQWINTLEVPLFPYDAGTEEGDTYSLNNDPTNPQEAISRIAGQSPFSEEPLGMFIITRLNQPDPT
ncbi:MAG: spondin domain-containing protein, partial [Chloroflexota bacterium]